jgi:mannose/cellobiose epimerase-like protein (N-acyl-D-glucosamine 2-epimerase family)
MDRPDLGAERARLLGFARGARVPGGFAWLDDDGRPEPRPPELWITTRMTHVFALGELLGEPDCAAFADHGLAAIATGFADAEHGGWRAQAGVPGKAAYDHAFVLLAGASAALAGRPGGAALLDRAAGVIDAHFWVEDEGVCRESWDDAWREPEPYRGANANMHMVEAFLAAGDATGEPRWAARALRIAERLIDREARARGWRVAEHFSAGWQPLPDYNADRPNDRFRPFGHTPGHALEWARLLLGLRAALPDPPDWLLEAPPALFDRALADGWDDGFVYTTDGDGTPVVRERMHWVVAEAIGAAATLHAVTGDARYADAETTFWAFAEAHLIDREHGGWRHELDAANRPAATTWSGRPDTYHAFQAALIPELGVAPSLAGALAGA